MAKRVNVPFDKNFFEFYKTLRDSDSPNFPPLFADSEISSRTEEMKSKIKDVRVKSHIGVLYSKLYEYCNKVSNGVNMEKGVNEFEEYLRDKTGRIYEINLVVDGNL